VLNEVPCHEDVLGSGGIALGILNLGNKWMWMVNLTPRLLYSRGWNLLYPLRTKLGGPQSQSGRGGEKKEPEPLPGVEPRLSIPYPSRYTDWATAARTGKYKRSGCFRTYTPRHEVL
jgi:hypothetical protein